jgi:hypothetical protein
LSDKRTHARFPIRLPLVLVHGEGQHAAFSGDIGLGGMFVHTQAPLPFGARIEVRMRLPALETEISVAATIRWQNREGMGIQFHGLRAREVWALNRLLRANARTVVDS